MSTFSEYISHIPFAALGAEFGGTALLLFFGCLGCVPSVIPALGAIAFGGALTASIQIFGHISGAHFNPAISLASFIFGIHSLPVVLLYILAQILGATAGHALAMFAAPNFLEAREPGSTFCNTLPSQEMEMIGVFVIEYMCTLALALICCSVWDKRNEAKQDSVALKFGFFLMTEALIAGPLSGGSFNPARTLGSSIINNNWEAHWIYWVAPLFGGVTASLLYKYLLSEGKQKRRNP